MIGRLRRSVARVRRELPRAAARLRRRPGTAGLALVATLVMGGGLLQLGITTDLGSFVPEGDPSVRALYERDQAFGGDPVVVLLETGEPGALVSGENLLRLMGLEGELSRLPNVAVVHGPGTAVNQVATQAQALLAQISGRRDALRVIAEQRATAERKSPAEVQAAVAAATGEFDLRYGGLLAEGLPTGLPTVKNPRFVGAVLFDPDGQPRAEWRYLLPSPTSVALLVRPEGNLDQSSTERLVTAVRAAVLGARLPIERLTVTGVPTVTASLGERVRAESPLLGTAAILVVLGSFAAARFLGPLRRRLLPPLIALAATGLALALFGWFRRPLSVGVVAFLPVLFGVASYYPLYLAGRARRRPVLVVAAASTASFASLALSPLPLVRELGLALAVGVAVAAGLAVLCTRDARGEPAGDASSGIGTGAVRWPRGRAGCA